MRKVATDDGPVWRVYYANDMPPGATANVMAHEIAHLIDDLAGRIPTQGIVRDLQRIYHIQNDGSARTPTLQDPPSRRTRPEDRGYKGDHVRAEQMAEAIRLYMQNPAYMKEHFPNVARRIREKAYPPDSGWHSMERVPRPRDTIIMRSPEPGG